MRYLNVWITNLQEYFNLENFCFMNLISNPTSLRQLRIEVKQRNPWLICYLLGIKLFRKVLGWTTFLNWRPLNFVFSLYPVGMWTEDRWWNFSGSGHSRQPTPPTPLPPSGVANPHQEVRPQSPHHLSRPLVILQTPPAGECFSKRGFQTL